MLIKSGNVVAKVLKFKDNINGNSLYAMCECYEYLNDNYDERFQSKFAKLRNWTLYYLLIIFIQSLLLYFV